MTDENPYQSPQAGSEPRGKEDTEGSRSPVEGVLLGGFAVVALGLAGFILFLLLAVIIPMVDPRLGAVIPMLAVAGSLVAGAVVLFRGARRAFTSRQQ